MLALFLRTRDLEEVLGNTAKCLPKNPSNLHYPQKMCFLPLSSLKDANSNISPPKKGTKILEHKFSIFSINMHRVTFILAVLQGGNRKRHFIQKLILHVGARRHGTLLFDLYFKVLGKRLL